MTNIYIFTWHLIREHPACQAKYWNDIETGWYETVWGKSAHVLACWGGGLGEIILIEAFVFFQFPQFPSDNFTGGGHRQVFDKLYFSRIFVGSQSVSNKFFDIIF